MYSRKYWQDHVAQYNNTYRQRNNPDGTITLIPVEGEIIQEGTPQNASNFNNLETGVFSAQECGAELVRLFLQQSKDLSRVRGEFGEVTLKNTQVYPFNNSTQSIALKQVRDTTDYIIEFNVSAVISGSNVGNIVITDKLKNGFKIAFTGGATSATIKYMIRGGIL